MYSKLMNSLTSNQPILDRTHMVNSIREIIACSNNSNKTFKGKIKILFKISRRICIRCITNNHQWVVVVVYPHYIINNSNNNKNLSNLNTVCSLINSNNSNLNSNHIIKINSLNNNNNLINGEHFKVVSLNNNNNSNNSSSSSSQVKTLIPS